MRLIPIYRIKTYVVPEHLNEVIEGVLMIDELKYGNYKHVAWHSDNGFEQFMPAKNAAPTEGEHGQKSKVSSIRIEFSIPKDEALLKRIIEEGIYPNHPWDEPVIQVSEELETRKHG